jgi:hypothetical protein
VQDSTDRRFFGLIVLFALAAACIAAFLGSAATATAADKNCSSFDNQKQAQKFFKKNDPKQDPHYLDADGDGIACETLPCPCKKKPAFREATLATDRRAGCDRINLGGQKVFYKQLMNCRTAKTYARRLYRSDGANKPDGFKCGSGSGWETGGMCVHRRNGNRLFGWHPLD